MAEFIPYQDYRYMDPASRPSLSHYVNAAGGSSELVEWACKNCAGYFTFDNSASRPLSTTRLVRFAFSDEVSASKFKLFWAA